MARRRRTGGWVVAACAVFAVGCSAAGPGPRACTEIGSPAGVSVAVARDVVIPAMELTLRICQGECRVERVDLMPGSVTLDETCRPDLPDGSCSASSSPDGTMVGFVDVGDLTAGEVRIRGELASGSSRTRLEEVTVVARATYPNGRDCAAGGPQASIQVTRAGLR